MLQNLLMGLLLGWGAAIPIGPINLEIVRRNLRYGTPTGIAFGFGAGLADITYLILLSIGALSILTHPTMLKIVGVIGACILAYFGFSALKSKKPLTQNTEDLASDIKPKWRHCLNSYLLTLMNPMTILFWSSVSTQIAYYSHQGKAVALYIGIGVLTGVLSWMLSLNVALHYTRHRLPEKFTHFLNIAGGIILIGFALFGLWHALFQGIW